MPEWIVTLLLGCIEGITEFLPISSTGHLLLFEHWTGDHRSDLFNVVIQAGAVLAVIPLFWKRVSDMLFRLGDPAVRDYTAKLLAAFFITGVGGVILEKLHFKLSDNPIPVATALLVGGILFVVLERMLSGRPHTDDISWKVAVVVGVAQLVAAVFPGSSRSGTTILACLALGLNRPAATEFSFLVGIPTMLAASGLKIVKALIQPAAGTASENWSAVGLGFVVSAVVSFVVVRWLLGYVRNHTFAAFGWYRIALGLVIFALVRG